MKTKRCATFMIIITFCYLLHSCVGKKDNCPSGMPAYLTGYINSNYRKGDTIVYENQFGKQLRIPVLGYTYSSSSRPYTSVCDIECYLSANYKDSVWVNLLISGAPVEYYNGFNYTLVLGKPTTEEKQKVMSVGYSEFGPGRGVDVYTSLGINKDSVIELKNTYLNGINYKSLFQVVPDSMGETKPSIIQYFYHRERGIVRFDERVNGQIWIRKF